MTFTLLGSTIWDCIYIQVAQMMKCCAMLDDGDDDDDCDDDCDDDYDGDGSDDVDDSKFSNVRKYSN